MSRKVELVFHDDEIVSEKVVDTDIGDNKKKIIKFLKKNPDTFYKPSEISLGIGFEKPKNTASTVNPDLYALLSQGKIKKKCDEGGKNPMWKVK